jgi:hypothetical protein
MAGKIQGDNSGNILVEFDYQNIIMVDPNKTINAGKISERLVDHEKLVMYANLEAEVIPRTKLSVGGSPEDRVRTISIAKINFLRPTEKNYLSTGYYDEITGKDSKNGKGANQLKQDTIIDANNKTIYQKMSPANDEGKTVDNGLLGITSINIRTNTSFVPSVSIELEDVQGRALFQLGDSSPYAAFFNLPYCPFYLTLKGYYGKAIRYQLNLKTFNARFNSFSGNYQITLEFVGYKFNILNEISMGHLFAGPHMYSQRFDVTTSPVAGQQGNATTLNNTEQAKVVNSTNNTNNVVTQVVSEKGYQKIVEVYSEYKSKGLIPKNFPEITVSQLMSKLELFEQNIINSYNKANVEPLTNIRNYKETLQNYFNQIRGSQSSWFNTYLNDKPLILTNGNKVYYYKTNLSDAEKETALTKLNGDVKTYNDLLAENKTLGIKGASPIKNNISVQMMQISIKQSDIDITKSVTEQTGILLPTEIDKAKFITNSSTLFKVSLDTTNLNKISLINPVFYIFEKEQNFDDTISKMQTEVNKKLSEYETLLSADLAKKIEDSSTGIGFKPTVRNIVAVIMASAEGFIRLLDDVHTNAWNVKYDSVRRNVILENPSSAPGTDTLGHVDISTSALNSNQGLSTSQQPVYPWPQFFVETPDDIKGRFQLKYIADPSVVSLTKGNQYAKWPEVEFVEEYMKGLAQKFNAPETQPPIDNGQFTNIININAIEYPSSGIAYVNKEEIKFFYEIWERQFLTSHYTGLIRGDQSQINELITLNLETESKNIITSLGKNSPFLSLKLKNLGLNSTNYVPNLENISNQGTGKSYQEFIRDFFVTPYIKGVTENSFSVLSTNDLGKDPQLSPKSDALSKLVSSTSTNNPLIVDTYPFTNSEWVAKNMGQSANSVGNSVYNTNKVLGVYSPRDIISNFTNINDYTTNRPVTNFSYLKVSNPIEEASTNLNIFYGSRLPKNFIPTEGYCESISPVLGVPTQTTTSILNTPYFINAIQNGVYLSRKKDTHPYIQAAYLFLNSLPLASLRERYQTEGKSDLDYISSCLKKFGAIHKMPYAWVLKFGSIWNRYKTYKESGVDILDSAWKSFDYTTNYSPISGLTSQTYSLKYPSSSPNNTNITLQEIDNGYEFYQTGFYPKLINDFNVFYNGYDLYSGYTDNEIQKSIDRGLKIFNFTTSNINGETTNGDILLVNTWSVMIPNNLDTSIGSPDICAPKDNTISGGYFIMPSFGGSINQTKDECFLNGVTKVPLTNNSSMYNGSVRLLWAAPNYGYFNSDEIKKPQPDSYLNFINPIEINQTPMSLLMEDRYSKIDEIFSVFEKSILDQFENEFLNFCKPSANIDLGIQGTKPIGVSSVNIDSSFKNFQTFFRTLMSVSSKQTSTTDQIYFQNSINTQLSVFSNGIKTFLEYDVILRYGNPSNYNRRVVDSFISQGQSTQSVVDPILFNQYVVNSLPSNGGTTTLSQSKLRYPTEWVTLELQVGFSTIPNLIYSSNGSYITDFFIKNDIEFTSQNITLCAPLIKMFATQKLNNPSLTGGQFKSQLKLYLLDLTNLQNDFLNQILDRVRKDLPNQQSVEGKTIKSIIDGQQSKVENYEVFKGLNDKWIAGSDFKSKTLFEDMMFLDRASRNIGDTIILDIFDLKNVLNQNALNMEMSVFTFISGILIKNNFNVMPLPAYVNFYNVQDVNGLTIPKTEGSLEFADNMWGTFLNVDYRNSGPKLVCFYVGLPSAYLALPKGNSRFRDDGFDMSRASENPLIESPNNKTDWAVSNRCVGFSVDIGIRNQNVFYSFNVSMDSGKATSESINTQINMVNQATGKSVATQNNSLYSLYKRRSYQCSVTCLGNALLQPTMYFNLRHVPMFNGPYMITDVQHSIASGTFQTTFTGVRQGIYDLPSIDNFLQSINQNLLTKIESLIITKKDEVTGKSTTDNNKSAEVVQSSNNTVSAENSCESNLIPYYKESRGYVISASSGTTVTPQKFAELLKNKIPNNPNLQTIIFCICYLRTYTKNNVFNGYNNNYSTIALTYNFGDTGDRLFVKEYSCINLGETTSKKSNSQPIAHFANIDNFISFMSERLTPNIGRIEQMGLDKYYVCHWPSDNVSEDYYDNNKNEFTNVTNNILKAIKLAGSPDVGLSVSTSADVTLTPPKNNTVITVPLCPPPSISSFTPTKGNGGTIVTINGSYLDFTTSVKIGGVSVSSITIINDNKISVVVDNATVTGFIEVTTAHGKITSTDFFRITI